MSFNIHDHVRWLVACDPRLHYLIEHNHQGEHGRVHQIASSADFTHNLPLTTHGIPHDNEPLAKKMLAARLKTLTDGLFGVQQ